MLQSNGLKHKSLIFSNYHTTGGNKTRYRQKRGRMMTDLASDWSVGPRLTDQSAESAPLGTQKQAIIIKIFTIFTQSTVLHSCCACEAYNLRDMQHDLYTIYRDHISTCNSVCGDVLLGSKCGTTGSGSQHLATVRVMGPDCWTISLSALTASSLLMFSNDISFTWGEGEQEKKRGGVTIVLYIVMFVFFIRRDFLTGGEKG